MSTGFTALSELPLVFGALTHLLPRVDLTAAVAARLRTGDLAGDRPPVEGDEHRDHNHAEDWKEAAKYGSGDDPGQREPKASADGFGPYGIDGVQQPIVTGEVSIGAVRDNGLARFEIKLGVTELHRDKVRPERASLAEVTA
jgi:hypothetical protein